MNVGSTSGVLGTCFAGRFLVWMLNGWVLIGKSSADATGAERHGLEAPPSISCGFIATAGVGKYGGLSTAQRTIGPSAASVEMTFSKGRDDETAA